MKLISEIINKRLELYNELEITHEYLKAVWHFYSVYNICLAVTGQEDVNTNKKNFIIKKLVKDFNFKTYSRLRYYMKMDFNVINRALQILQEIKEDSDFYGDYDLPNMIAISVYD